MAKKKTFKYAVKGGQVGASVSVSFNDEATKQRISQIVAKRLGENIAVSMKAAANLSLARPSDTTTNK